MFGKLLLLLFACSSDLASTHIVTSAHSDLTFLSCVTTLTNTVQTLCLMHGQIGQYSIEYMNPALEPQDAETTSWEFRNNIKRCCTRPCGVPELLAVC